MNNKEKLDKIPALVKESKRRADHIEGLRRMQTQISTPKLDGMPRNPNYGAAASFETITDQIVDEDQALSPILKKLDDVRKAFDKLGNEDQIMFLEYRYFQDLSIKKIAEKMHYSESKIYRLEQASIEAVVLPDF